MERNTFKEAFVYSLNLLSKRDYSLRALEKKVREKFPDIKEEEVELLGRELLKSGYVNEWESARRYFLRKVEKGWGKRKIAHHLRSLGFPEEVIREVELTTPFDYSYIEREVSKLSSRKNRDQIKRFLLQRGFSFSEVSHILKKVK